MSRRTVVRATGAAVALGGVARLLVRPPSARADAFGSFQECVDYNYKLNDYIYDQCTKGPLAAIKAADAAIAKAQAAEKTAKSKGQKARQHAILVQNQVARIKAVDALMDCGFQLAHDRSKSFSDCHVDHPAGSSGGAGGGGVGAAAAAAAAVAAGRGRTRARRSRTSPRAATAPTRAAGVAAASAASTPTVAAAPERFRQGFARMRANSVSPPLAV